MGNFVQKHIVFVAAVFCAILLAPTPSFAFGLSPPEVRIERTLTSSSSPETATVNIQRGVGDTGALVFSVSSHGDCEGCVTGANTLVMGPDDDAVSYELSVSPGETIVSGDYRHYVAFLIDETVETSGNAVQRGVTATVRFSVTGGPTDGGGGCGSCGTGGGGGGSGSGGSTATDDPGGSAEPPVVLGPPEPASDASDADDSSGAASPTSDTVSSEPAPSEQPSGFASTGSTEPEEAAPNACANESFSLDRNGDGTADESDMTAFMDAYLESSCSLACDVNADCAFTLRDLAVISGRIAPSSSARSDAPVTAGPILPGAESRFYFQKGSEYGRYEFVVAAAENASDDGVVFYLLADTDAAGMSAFDVIFSYDADVMELSDVSTVGSAMKFLRGSYGAGAKKTIRLVGTADDPVAGTGEYLAAFRFRPLVETETTLAFASAKFVGGGATAETKSGTTDLSGSFRMVVPAAADSGAPPLVVPRATTERTCPCLRRDLFPICLALLGALVSSVLALIVLRRIYRVKNDKQNDVANYDE